ncbi:MAG: ABC transporter permease [Actinomycetia bacterium]|nr:ABC transporter permease [Actinomycetes bacterium]
MFRLTLKGLAANKVRFALTTFGVMLAVSFVVSAFVLGDGLRSSFTDLSEDITSGVDIEVRNVAEFGDPQPLPMETVAVVAGIDGVADAVASIESAENAVRPIKANGELIEIAGPPQLAFAWIESPRLNPFAMVEGTPPEVGQFVIDLDAADQHGFVIGEAYELIIPTGRTNLTLSGTTTFGEDNSTLGAVLMAVNTAEANELFDLDGITDVAVVVDDGADVDSVLEAITAALPASEVVDNATVLEETTTGFTDEIDIVSNILLGFGGVALFVSIFIIYNTFAIVLGQRIRELALLRTVGASPRQIRRSVLGEALAVGVIASLGGIGGGVAVAKGLEALFGTIGADLPEYPLILATRTLVAATVIGVGMTMLAAYGPARRASTVPPIVALRGGADAGAAGSLTRKVSGVGLFAMGIVSGVVGLAGTGSTATTVALMAAGAMTVFLGVTLLSPLAVGPITKVAGWPLRKVAGVAGSMAQRNAARNSRRTATTAAALMIGLALVTTALVVGDSVKTNISTTFDDSAVAEYYITDQLEEVEFPTTLVDDIVQSGSVDAGSGFRYVEARVEGTVENVGAADFSQLPLLLDLDVQTGSYGAEATHSVLVSDSEAQSLGLAVGDTVTTEFSNGAMVEATVSGVFHDQVIVSQDYLFDTSVFDSAGVEAGDEWLAFSIPEGVDPVQIQSLLDGLADQFPSSDIETADEFRDRIAGFVDTTLAMVNIMVALAVVIALIGIANTLALSVFERTRELGLVRAVGMTRRQLRRMVRFEAALVATFGAVLGVGIGLLFGWGVVGALPESFAATVSIPTVNIAILMMVAATAGVVAAWLPARRAGRMNVLDAIAH